MDFLKALSTFTRLVEAGSLSKAASQMNTTQSAISKRLAVLEDTLGTKLLTRSTRRQSTTESGEILYDKAIQILELVGVTRGEITSAVNSVRGKLRIQTPNNLGEVKVVQIVAEFLTLYPQIEVDLLVDNRNIDLIENGIDLAFRVGEQENTSYISRVLSAGDRFLVASPSYLKRFGKPTSPEELIKHNCLIDLFWSDVWQFGSSGNMRNINISGNFTSNNANMVKHLAINGHGIGIFGLWSIEPELKSNLLKIIDLGLPLAPVPINVIYLEKRYLPQKIRKFIEFSVNAFEVKERLSSNI